MPMQRIVLSIAAFIFLFALGGCASTPVQTDNACAVLIQKNGFFYNWRNAAKRAEREYGIPMPIILATIYTESGFRQRAKPPRTKLLGFIPWKRQSSAYGYSQALNGTWEHYRYVTGRHGASRANFADTALFIAWFHRESVRKNSVRANDAYALYLNYYLGHTAYARGSRGNATAVAGARRTLNMARLYDRQLRNCGRR